MGTAFEELDFRQTRLGALSLRRRLDAVVGRDVYEIKLDDDYLMSSQFTVAETRLAELGMAALEATDLDVLVGGLGLGYTACAALADPRTQSVTVVEALPEIIEWHQRGLVPLGEQLSGDTRCHFVNADFFAFLQSPDRIHEQPAQVRRYHAILLDIDHSPRHFLHPDHAGFYSPGGMLNIARGLHAGGVFAMWSNDPCDPEFLQLLGVAFPAVEAKRVEFRNPYQKRQSSSTIYVARLGGGDQSD